VASRSHCPSEWRAQRLKSGIAPLFLSEASYEEWRAEDCRITWFRDERRYAITNTGTSSPDGPRACVNHNRMILLAARALTFARGPPAIAGANKNCGGVPREDTMAE
jgi:hypothetical protein